MHAAIRVVERLIAVRWPKTRKNAKESTLLPAFKRLSGTALLSVFMRQHGEAGEKKCPSAHTVPKGLRKISRCSGLGARQSSPDQPPRAPNVELYGREVNYLFWRGNAIKVGLAEAAACGKSLKEKITAQKILDEESGIRRANKPKETECDGECSRTMNLLLNEELVAHSCVIE